MVSVADAARKARVSPHLHTVRQATYSGGPARFAKPSLVGHVVHLERRFEAGKVERPKAASVAAQEVTFTAADVAEIVVGLQTAEQNEVRHWLSGSKRDNASNGPGVPREAYKSEIFTVGSSTTVRASSKRFSLGRAVEKDPTNTEEGVSTTVITTVSRLERSPAHLNLTFFGLFALPEGAVNAAARRVVLAPVAAPPVDNAPESMAILDLSVGGGGKGACSASTPNAAYS